MVIFVCIYLLIAGSATDSDEELLEAALAAEAQNIILNTQFSAEKKVSAFFTKFTRSHKLSLNSRMRRIFNSAVTF